MSKISGYAALTAPVGGDELVVVDVSDTSMAPSGTTKKLALADLLGLTGLKLLTGTGAVGTTGGTVAASTITSAQSAGFTGLYLDPRYIWDLSGLVINGISNFVIASDMVGSIGWTANTSATPGYCKTDTGSPADGVQVYASAPGSGFTQGVKFRNLVFKGSHSGGRAVHFGGGQRRCSLENCLVWNTASAANSYAFMSDTALSDSNSENNQFTRCAFASGWAAVGLGINDQTQHTNDQLFTDCVTSGGTYSINAATASNTTFINWYDRSSPATANVLNSAGVLTFIGGEHLNNTGVAHQVTGGTTILQNVLVSAGGASVTSGSLACLGRCRIIGTVALGAGSGTLVLADPSGSYGSTTVTGTAGTLLKSGQYSPGSGPAVTGWSGTTHTSTWA